MSGEREVWRKRRIVSSGDAPDWWGVYAGARLVVECLHESDADQIVREHNAYQDAVEALEAISRRIGVDQPWAAARTALQSIKEQGS